MEIRSKQDFPPVTDAELDELFSENVKEDIHSSSKSSTMTPSFTSGTVKLPAT